MKLISLLILIISIFWICCNKSNEKVLEEYSDGTPKVVVKQKGDSVKLKIGFYKSGQKKFIRSFDDDVLNGKYFQWDSAGKLIGEGNYVDGSKHGWAFRYRQNGHKEKTFLYHDGTQLILRKHYPSGNKSFEINSKENMIYGWYKNGQLRAEIPNVNGKCNYYFKDGSLQSTGYLKKGKDDSLWRYYNKQGKLVKEIEFDMGDTVSVKEFPEAK